jgi:hypothetical protein
MAVSGYCSVRHLRHTIAEQRCAAQRPTLEGNGAVHSFTHT